MSRTTILVLVGVLACAGAATPQEKPAEQQIAEAVSPLADAMREGATVYGYQGGSLTTLRQGSNEMICLADDPAAERWSVACYHESLEPFMARGRELRAEGKDMRERQTIRGSEIEAGTLAMPDGPAALYVLSGPDGSFDPATGQISGANRRSVVYVPYATAETTGLATEPSPTEDSPWLMAPGKPWAHIMISG
jgi:hypothetical protein